MTIGTGILIWEIVVNVGLAGLSFAFVSKKMKENGKKRRDF